MSAPIRTVRVRDLYVDERYQREPDSHYQRVKKQLLKNFDENRLGLFEVSERPDGKLAILDGQLRHDICLHMGIGEVPARVHPYISAEHEAILYISFNTDRRGMTQLQRFKAKHFSRDPSALEIYAILTDEGYTIDSRRHSGDTISAILTVQTIYRRWGGNHLRYTLQSIREIWGAQEGALQGAFLSGMARFLADWGDTRFNDEKKNNLRKYDPVAIRRTASAISGGGSQIGVRVAKQIQEIAKVRGHPRKFKKT